MLPDHIEATCRKFARYTPGADLSDVRQEAWLAMQALRSGYTTAQECRAVRNRLLEAFCPHRRLKRQPNTVSTVSIDGMDFADASDWVRLADAAMDVAAMDAALPATVAVVRNRGEHGPVSRAYEAAIAALHRRFGVA